MASLRLQINDKVVYEGPAVAVPRVDDGIQHDDKVLRVASVVWDFTGANGDVLVTLHVSETPYTF